MFEYLITGQSAAARPAATRVALQRGTLPQHPAAYGYGGPGSPSLSASDPMASIPAASSPYAARRRTQLTMLPEPGPQEGMIAQAVDPSYQRQVVPSEDGQCPGTIVVDTTSRHLYLVQPGGRAIRYGIGVGRPGFLWRGIKTVSQKREWPDWTPPAEMLRRRPDLPRHMEGGDNPLGARAISAPHSTASTAPTSRIRSDKRSRPAASA